MTFDDATGDHLEVARELAARHIPAVFFVTFGVLGREGHLDDAALRELVALGHVVGSHALDHAPLAGLSREELRVQVRDSKARLEAVVEEPVRFFAPPAASAIRRSRPSSSGPRTRRAVRCAGGCTVRRRSGGTSRASL